MKSISGRYIGYLSLEYYLTVAVRRIEILQLDTQCVAGAMILEVCLSLSASDTCYYSITISSRPT